ncbi:hypothetical protein F2Q70_00000500 [Brassica cretica]|uniref:Uncharacterized protein n=1 Tax=Brassica cretica TaxID=69181 RepID=A0A8S9IQR4_BRACR|nr:hypothetical protein F2Q70_00000500 [Brassica cretica]
MTTNPVRWPTFATEIEVFQRLREDSEDVSVFHFFRNRNGRMDALAKETRIRGFIFFHIDQNRPDEDAPGKIDSSDHHLNYEPCGADKCLMYEIKEICGYDYAYHFGYWRIEIPKLLRTQFWSYPISLWFCRIWMNDYGLVVLRCDWSQWKYHLKVVRALRSMPKWLFG